MFRNAFRNAESNWSDSGAISDLEVILNCYRTFYFDEFGIASSIVMWNRYFWYRALQEFTERLPSILYIPYQKIFFRHLIGFENR